MYFISEWKYGRWCKLAGYIHGHAVSYLPESQRTTPSLSVQISMTPFAEKFEEVVDDEKETSS